MTGKTPTVLILNPNTSAEVTASIGAMARAAAGERAGIALATARFGAGYISSPVDFTIAAHAVLDTAAAALPSARPDALVIGCFGDPGIDALAEITGLPVVGFAEAGLRAAAALPGLSLVATRGAFWTGVLRDLAVRLGLIGHFAGFLSLESADVAGTIAEIETAAKDFGVARVVLGGAGLIPIIPEVAAGLSVPLLDPHRAAIEKAIELAGAPHVAPERAANRYSGLSAELAELLGD